MAIEDGCLYHKSNKVQKLIHMSYFSAFWNKISIKLMSYRPVAHPIYVLIAANNFFNLIYFELV
jgi:hypothetical protein